MASPLSYSQFLALPQPPAPRILAYGHDPLQHVELWRPRGKGPFPVVLMLHGGCWQTAVGTAAIMHRAAADLMKRGIAVWSVEYRGVDVPGGGYPGTFHDVAAAADLLVRDGAAMGLATDHVVALGHSAGGHLAFWLAGRRRIAPTSWLWSAHPLPIAGVVSLGGLPDLEMPPPRRPGRAEPARSANWSGRRTPIAPMSMPTPRRWRWRRSAAGRCRSTGHSTVSLHRVCRQLCREGPRQG